MKVPTSSKPLTWIHIVGDLTLSAYEVLYDEGKLNLINLLDELNKLEPLYSDFIFKNLQFSVRVEDTENDKFYIIIEPEINNKFRIIRFDGKRSHKLGLNRCLIMITRILKSRRKARSKISNMPVNESTYTIKLKGPSDITNIYRLLAWIEDCGAKNISSTIELHCDGTRVKWSVSNNKESINSKTCEEINL